MAAANCPQWDYEKHPNAGAFLPQRCRELLVWLRAQPRNTIGLCSDTRPPHNNIFTGLTIPDQDYLAGHYRGEDFPCLKYLNVNINTDPRVGVPFERVDGELHYLTSVIQEGVNKLDGAYAIPDAHLPRNLKVYYAISFACRVFVHFLTVHPFANGNGHMGRFIIWSILGRYQYWPRRWPVNDRPPDPPYSDLIKKYRDGESDPLEQFVLKCVLGII